VSSESEMETRITPAKLVATAAIFAIVKWSTRHIRPIINVKNPLMLDKIVALATCVRPRPAVNDQLARNQRKQNTDARWAVSRTVRGGKAAEVDSGSAWDE